MSTERPRAACPRRRHAIRAARSDRRRRRSIARAAPHAQSIARATGVSALAAVSVTASADGARDVVRVGGKPRPWRDAEHPESATRAHAA